MKLSDRGIVLTTGFALFAMFFGAGNIVLPMILGAHAGDNILYVASAFVLSGVFIPFFGLYAASLYKGDYHKFFSVVGRVPGIVLVTFLILVIGPLFAAPRTEVITYGTLLPYLGAHTLWGNKYFFSLFYFSVVFALVFRGAKVVDILGRFLCPVKLVAFAILIVLGVMGVHALMTSTVSPVQAFTHSLSIGYSTMDLLGAFFYCNVAYRSIVKKCEILGDASEKRCRNVMLKACVVGAICFTCVYLGLMVVTYIHAGALDLSHSAGMIQQVSALVLGPFGSIFVCVCIFFACLATATALVEVSSYFFSTTVFRGRISRNICVVMILLSMYCMSLLGFRKIMQLILPVLNYVYPLLIVICVINVVRKMGIYQGLSEKILFKQLERRLYRAKKCC